MNEMKPYYQDDSVTIYHGDCREILPSLEPVDLVLTDPPYGIQHSSGYGASWQNTEIEGDFDTSVRDYMLERSILTNRRIVASDFPVRIIASLMVRYSSSMMIRE